MLAHTRALVAAVACVLSAGGSVSAGLLTGTGNHLPLPPSPGVMPSYEAPTFGVLTPTRFAAAWTSPPVAPAWAGVFSGFGPYPSSPAGASTSTFDFTGAFVGPTVGGVGIGGRGILPANTLFLFSDVDSGGRADGSMAGLNVERFVLQAFDPTGALITTEWLTEPVATWGLRGSTDPNAMPGWAWDNLLSTYTIDGTTVTNSNPQFTFALLSVVPIGSLEVQKSFTDFGFGLGAPRAATPVPEPASLLTATITFGLLGCYCLRRHRPRLADAVREV